MLNPIWLALGVFTLVGGVLVILAPQGILYLNGQLNKALMSVDDLIMRYRHFVGAVFMIVAYLCFRLALLVGTSF